MDVLIAPDDVSSDAERRARRRPAHRLRLLWRNEWVQRLCLAVIVVLAVLAFPYESVLLAAALVACSLLAAVLRGRFRMDAKSVLRTVAVSALTVAAVLAAILRQRGGLPPAAADIAIIAGLLALVETAGR